MCKRQRNVLFVSGYYGKNYVEILWPNILKAKHTDEIVIRQPVRYDAKHLNDDIYENNLKLYHSSYQNDLSGKVFESNNILRSIYMKNGYSITNTGKWHLFKN